MVDPIETQETWAVEPFDMEAWLAFSAKDRFLKFQQRDMRARCERLAGGGMGTVEGLLTKYLEAQYNECHEDSLLARKWNAFVKRRAKGEALKARLRHHVTGAIERGEGEAIAAKPIAKNGVKFDGMLLPCKTLADAVWQWEQFRDATSCGARECSGAKACIGGKLYRISYNGRVWHPSTGAEILIDPATGNEAVAVKEAVAS